MTGVIIVWAFIALGWLVERVTDEIDGQALACAGALCVLVPMWACDDHTSGASDGSMALDGSVCAAGAPDGPELFELALIPEESDCDPINARVRRLDGPSNAGACQSMASFDARMCSIDFTEECEIDGVAMAIDAELSWDDVFDWWTGTAEVTRETIDGAGEDPEACAGTYRVEIERIR